MTTGIRGGNKTDVFQRTVKPSLRFAMLLLLFHLVVAAVVCVTAMPLVLRLAMLLLIALSLFYYLARDALLLFRNSWCDISFAQGCVYVVARDGSSFAGQVANETTVSPYFVVLRIRLEGHRMPVSRVIFPDAMNAGAFRELCIHLKFA
jgi:uncharacterized membrane protein YedE/YeeE